MAPEFTLRDRWIRDKFERQTRPLLATLYRTARRLAGQPADAEDLVHDAYLKAFQAFPAMDLPDEAACRAWLLRIMINTYRDRYRRRVRAAVLVGSGCLDDADGATLPCPDPGPDRHLEQKRFAQAADAAIARLPSEVRLVVVPFFVEQLSCREIAEIAQCPLGTVMSRLWRGRRLLREALRAYAEHQPSGPSEAAMRADRRRMP
jgi:RNA polymerase sigma-70 factor (ECF subfamily)